MAANMSNAGKRAPTSFGWTTATKRPKMGHSALAIELAASLEAEEEREKCALDEWMRRQAASSVLQLEDAAGLSARRKDEGCVLADAGRFHEAIARFGSALECTPASATLHELQAQCYMEVGDTYAAIKAAGRAVECDAQWAVGRQTLGRAQRNLGEIEMAIVSFETALRIDPGGMTEVRDEDLPNAKALLAQQQAMMSQTDAQFLSGPLAQDRVDLPPSGSSKPVRHVLGDSIRLSALPPGELMRPHGS
jgi:tetratricopeptide (TPR) repeat protein